jgi:glutamate-ammonia-ligase adenylyltransferase
MLQGHPNPTDLFDVKHDRGGMVDVEFTVQTLVLSHCARHRELVNNFGNTHLLDMAAGAGLIPRDLASRCARAYRHYRVIQREIRLIRGETAPARVNPESVAGDRQAVLELWRTVFGDGGPGGDA